MPEYKKISSNKLNGKQWLAILIEKNINNYYKKY